MCNEYFNRLSKMDNMSFMDFMSYPLIKMCTPTVAGTCCNVCNSNTKLARCSKCDGVSWCSDKCMHEDKSHHAHCTYPTTRPATKKCDQCGVSGKMLKCSLCCVAKYCGQECQKAAWKSGHKQACIS